MTLARQCHRIIQITDTHLRRGCAESAPGWQDTVDLIATRRPDLVIHTGDIVWDDPHAIDDHGFAMEALGSICVPVRAVPGNHDIGDGPPIEVGPDLALLPRFEAHYGVSHWVETLGGWRIVGINSLLLGTGTTAEADHWLWLEETLHGGAGRPIALFMHKPPFVVDPDEREDSSAAIPVAARQRFWSTIARAPVRLIACGHRHEYRTTHCDGVGIVWGPTTTALLSERTPPLTDGHYAAGCVEYVLAGGTIIHRFLPLPDRRAE